MKSTYSRYLSLRSESNLTVGGSLVGLHPEKTGEIDLSIQSPGKGRSRIAHVIDVALTLEEAERLIKDLQYEIADVRKMLEDDLASSTLRSGKEISGEDVG